MISCSGLETTPPTFLGLQLADRDAGKMLRFEASGQEGILEMSWVQKGGFIKGDRTCGQKSRVHWGVAHYMLSNWVGVRDRVSLPGFWASWTLRGLAVRRKRRSYITV